MINIITKKAGNKPVNGDGSLSYGSWNSFWGSGGLNGRKDKVDYNINYSLHTLFLSNKDIIWKYLSYFEIESNL